MKNLVFLVLICLALGSCNKKKPRSSSNSEGGVAPIVTELEGVWVGDCDSSLSASSKEVLTFTTYTLTRKYYYYTSANCVNNTHLFEQNSTYTFSLPGTTTATVPEGTTPIDLMLATYTQVYPDVTPEILNNAPCGITDWVSNQEKDIIGKICNGITIIMNDDYYDIYQLTGTTLKIGLSYGARSSLVSTGRSDSTRPVVLKNIYFNKN